MIKIAACITNQHSYVLLLAAAAICVLGSVIAIRLFGRVRRTSGFKKANWLFLAALTCGSVIWTTHFVAMLGYRIPLEHAYDPPLTLASFFIAIGASAIGMALAAATRQGPLVEVGGAVLGIGIAAMHYCGMAAYDVAGIKTWDPNLVAASVALGGVFGILATNRLARPLTWFCRHGAVLALILAILTTHFVGMGALTITPDPVVAVPPQLMPDGALAVGVIAVMSLVLCAAVSIYLIDSRTHSEAVERYRQLALHDPLTGLPNRAFLGERLKDMLGDSIDDTSRIAVLWVDLDRFKPINDVHGHGAGDLVLQSVASRLSGLLGGDDFLARVGGDEFAVVKRGLYTEAQATAFASRVVQELCRPIEGEEGTFLVGASVGGSLFPKHGPTAQDLLGRAELAKYRAKEATFESVCFYDETMDETKRLRSLLTMELRQAIARDQLEVYYQPQHAVGSRALVGFEALLRWHHPERGLVPPDVFIPIAEETGLIMPIGEWVLRRACADAAGWREPCSIAVNVAPAQFLQSNLPQLVAGILAETGLPAERLELEITESSIIDDQHNTLHLVRQLKGLGVRIAMDDYGTGYSSLSMLQTFPFDKIKIDRSLIRGVESDAPSAAIVEATILLARSLGIPVLAEGVETGAHLEFLKAIGCQEAQGFYFGRPEPLASVLPLIGAAVSVPTEEDIAHAAAMLRGFARRGRAVPLDGAAPSAVAAE